jgi:uncharacterized membrane protein
VYGKTNAAYFIFGAILGTSLIENFAVLEGSYTYFTHVGYFGGSFGGYLLWVGAAPLWVDAGWIVVVLSIFIISHEVLLKGRSPLAQAAFTGLFAMNMDLVIDPVAVANNLWNWTEKSFYVLGVPVDNWLGWFLIASVFDLIFNATILREASVPVLGPIEDVFMKGSYNGRAKAARFVFRICVSLFLVAVLLSALQVGLGALS